jgi:predicted RNA-binding protein with PUA-like domain
VDLVLLKPLAKPVSLDAMKADRVLKEMKLIRNSRLSVTPLTDAQAKRLLNLAETEA